MAERRTFLILGHGRHGKDTAAEYLRDEHGVSFTSSSLFLAAHVVRPALVKYGLRYPSVEACYADRVNNRILWRDIIRDYNGDDPARLARAILSVSDCYVGMRTDAEYQASKTLFDVVLWVDASARDLPPDPSLTIAYDPNEMVLIDNGSDVQNLHNQLDDWMAALRWFDGRETRMRQLLKHKP